VDGPAQSHRRSRAPFLLTALGVSLFVAVGSCAVLWLAVHLLTGVPEDGRPLADGAELLKIALAVGLSEWAEAAQGP
jgi:hypothetical protein